MLLFHLSAPLERENISGQFLKEEKTEIFNEGNLGKMWTEGIKTTVRFGCQGPGSIQMAATIVIKGNGYLLSWKKP